MEQASTQHQPPLPDPLGSGPAGRRWALGLLALAVLAGVAVGAYLLGRSSVDTGAAHRRGFERGQAAAAGRYTAGAPGYRAIYEQGRRAGLATGRTVGLRLGQRQGNLTGAEKGRRVGLEQGEAIGTLAGERAGIAAGASAALGGFSSWESGGLYIVEVQTGEQGVPYRLSARKRMTAKERYALCAEDPARVCLEPVPKP